MALEDVTAELSSPERAYWYAIGVIQGRFPQGEAVIAQDAGYAYHYALHIIRGRFPQGEEAIAQDAGYAYWYAIYVIKDRFPEGEAVIAQAPMSALYYYNDFKDQFTEHERVLWLLKI